MLTLLASLVVSQHPGSTLKMDPALTAVASIHGEAGPWAVAGYRMGLFALKKLELPAQSHELKVVHRSPRSPQYACVADGAQAATGASVGKLNLTLEETPLERLQTTFTNARTGVSVTLKPTRAFLARFTNAPREKAFENAKAVLTLPDAEVFELVLEK